MTVLALDVARLSFWLGVSLVASLAALAIAIACGFGAASINRSKGRSARAGFWLGFCFPLIAIAVAALLPRRASPSDRGGDVPSSRVLARVAIGVGAAALLVPAGAIFAYTQFINDPEPRLDTNDLADLVGGDSATTTAGAALLNAALLTPSADTEASDDSTATSDSTATECAAASTTGTTPADAATEPSESTGPADSSSDEGGFDGVWAVTSESEFGYRVPEVLAGVETEAVGRGNEISGSLTVSGSEVSEACFVVQVASITSDESQRDGQFNGRIMETSTFPTATFVLTEPIVLEELPEVGGDAVTATATGELTLHGVTDTVTFDVTIQAGDDLVGVLGEIPIVFADYDIGNPSGGPAQVGDEGVLEFLLAFEPA